MGEGNIPDADGQFENAPYVNFNDGQLKFDTNWFDNANDNYGSASGFSPKSFLKNRRGHPFDGMPLAVRPQLLNRGGHRLHPAAQHPTDFVDL